MKSVHSKLGGSRNIFATFCFASVAMFLQIGCGGGGVTSTPLPPPPALGIATASLPDWMQTFAYSQTIQATGGVAPLTWAISSGSLPHNLTLANSSTYSVTISGTPDMVQTATFTIQATDSKSRAATQSYIINIKKLVSAQLQEVQGPVPAGSVEIQGVSTGSFNPTEWQQDTLNWVPDVRVPMVAPQSGPFQNIYSPWPLEQINGWRMFYGGWDGTATSNDRVYSVTTSDFLSFNDHQLVIDHGDFLHVNNVNVTQLPDGSMHMICTIALTQTSNGKPAYFFSPDGVIWNGSPEPYSAQLSDVVSIPNDPLYAGYDYNGANVLFRENGSWTLYYSVGIYGDIGKVYRATSVFPPVFQAQGVALATLHYANDVKKFHASGKDWYLMALYEERVSTNPAPVSSFYSLSNDGIQFGREQVLFGPAYAQDLFLMTPAFLTKGDQVMGVLYGGNPVDLLNPNQIFARWLQKRVLITDSSGIQYFAQGGYGPDRQWFTVPASGLLEGTMVVYAEDGVTPLGSSFVTLSAGKAYTLVLK